MRRGAAVAGKVLGGLLGQLLYWAPVWVPLVLLWQVGTRGLQPALAEEARLERLAPEVMARHAREKARFEHLDREVRAWNDPVYRERRRRMLERH